jgi:hypothetical protein
MVRRSTVDRRPQSVDNAAGFPAAGSLGSGNVISPGRPRPWRGAGGRWLVWLFRIIAWLAILLIGYRGITAIVSGETTSSKPPPAASHGSGFPAGLASAYALQFGQAYLNANPATAAKRSHDLAAFLPPGSDSQLGWNGGGSLRLQGEQVAGVRVQDSQHAVVTLLARVNDQLMELGVPVYASGRAMAVSGQPAWLPAPKRANVPSSAVTNTDSVTQAALMSQLPAFFQAYASGNQVTLGRFLAPGSRLTGLRGQVTFGSLSDLTVPSGGDTRHVTAVVTWRLPAPPATPGVAPARPGSLQMSYALTLLKSSGSWYVKAISSSTQPMGQP